MRRLLLSLVLGSLSLGTFAQEAFYIYRNDGDFNGFFYDEVVEMRYSKIDFDSIEHDNYVICEVELADTIYRIPLASIDSIGFQQPEIKFNPNVRFLEQEGWCPYISSLNDSVMVMEDIPAEIAPQVDFVIIGLPTDSCNTLYEELGGSYGLVVQSINKEGNTTYVHGRPIEKIGEIFEQFICLEQIGVDSLGNVHRRVAGRMPEGMRRMPMEEGHGSLDLVDLSGSFTRDWKPGGDTSKVAINLTADVNIKVRMRVAYDIRWYKFYAKISRDYQFRVKPSVGVTGTIEWKVSTDDLVEKFPPVLFPAACPLFEIKPFPALFMNVSGTIDARLNLPQVYLGFGDDVIMNSLNVIAPIMFTLHLVPDENTEPTEEMLDLSASLKYTGTIYTGVALQAIINTNSYFRKIFQCGIGANFSIGPKVSGEIAFSTDMLSSPNVYPLLSTPSLTMNYLSIGMDVTAKAKVGWGDDKETTFFSSSKDFFSHSMRLAPLFEASSANLGNSSVDISLKPKPGIILLYNKFDAALFDTENFASNPEPKFIAGDWTNVVITDKQKYDAHISRNELKATTYHVAPYVYGPGGPYVVSSAKTEVDVPLKASVSLDSLHFDANGEPVYVRTFTTNCPPEGVSFRPGFYMKDSLVRGGITVIDSVNGVYELSCSALPNERLFSSDTIKIPAFRIGPGIYLDAGGTVADSAIYFGFSQDANDLSNMSMHFSGHFNGTLGEHTVVFNGHVKARRVPYPDKLVIIEDTIVSGYETTVINITLAQDTVPCNDCIGEHYYASGSLEKNTVDSHGMPMKTERFSFENAEGKKTHIIGGKETITGAMYVYSEIENGEGGPMITQYGNFMTPGDPENRISIHLYPLGDPTFNAPRRQ